MFNLPLFIYIRHIIIEFAFHICSTGAMTWSCNNSVVNQAAGLIHSDGFTFVKAVNTLMAAHCALTTESQWPPDRRDDVLAGKK